MHGTFIVYKQHEDQGEFIQVSILTRMHALRTEDGNDPRPMLNELQRLHAEYATAGGLLDDAGHKVLILKCLPLSYRGVVRTILSSAHLIASATRSTSSSTTPSSTTSPTTSGSGISPNALIKQIYAIARDEFALSSPDPADDSALVEVGNAKCSNCGRGGHTKPNCWSRGGGKEGQGPRSKARRERVKPDANESANTAAVVPDSDGEIFTFRVEDISTTDVDAGSRTGALARL